MRITFFLNNPTGYVVLTTQIIFSLLLWWVFAFVLLADASKKLAPSKENAVVAEEPEFSYRRPPRIRFPYDK